MKEFILQNWCSLYILFVLIVFLVISHIQRKHDDPMQRWDALQWIKVVSYSILWFVGLPIIILVFYCDSLLKERKLGFKKSGGKRK